MGISDSLGSGTNIAGEASGKNPGDVGRSSEGGRATERLPLLAHQQLEEVPHGLAERSGHVDELHEAVDGKRAVLVDARGLHDSIDL